MHRSPTVRRRRLAAAAVSITFALGTVAACSSGSDDAGSTTTTTVDGTTTTVDGTTTTSSGGGSTTTTTGSSGPVTTTTSPRTTTTIRTRPGPDGAEAAYISAMADTLGSDFETDVTDCIAEDIVRTIGVDRFEAAGIGPEELDDEESPFVGLGLDGATAESLHQVMDDCTGGLYEAMIESIAGSDAETASCLRSNISTASMKSLFIELFKGNSPDQGAFESAVENCLGVPE